VSTLRTMPLEPMILTAADRETLEAECSLPTGGAEPRAGMVLCHPHPLQGGTMRSIVISALFNALPDSGVACLRFNFRGVEGSSGVHDEGDSERYDALAAIDALAGKLPPGTPLILTGWSFGADVALSVHDPRLAAWIAIAGPLRFVREPEVTAADPRPKLLVLAQRDEVRPPAEIEAEVAGWTNTRTVTIPGASHFFIGRTDQLVVVARELVGTVVDQVAGGS
jgi:uncharacterized protein